MNKTLIVIGIFSLSGCAITSSHHSGPNGRPVHWIDGTSASAAYAQAGELCPHGYEILGAPMQVSIVDYEMTVECKSPNPVQGMVNQELTTYSAQPRGVANPASHETNTSREQQIQELKNTPGLSYEEYQYRYKLIMGQ